jgi:uncharacterized protein YndB with AHSA1/START domain
MTQDRMEIEKAVVIDRPPDRVWSYIADPRNDLNWCRKVLSVKQVQGESPGAHATYRVVHRPVRLKKPKELTVTVEEFEPPHRMRMREEDEDGVFDVTYELQPAEGGTRLTQREAIDWKIPRLQLPIARRTVSRDVQNQLATLKRLLEAS